MKDIKWDALSSKNEVLIGFSRYACISYTHEYALHIQPKCNQPYVRDEKKPLSTNDLP
jgi:hypothetical protein